MEIFHYIADQLQGVPNFERGTNYVSNAESGAIYNDFHCDPREALGSIDNDLTFSQDQTRTETKTGFKKVSVPRQCIDHAILEADREHDILYKHYLLTALRSIVPRQLLTRSTWTKFINLCRSKKSHGKI